MEYQEIWENLTADKGDIVELYAEFEKQSKSAPPVSTLRTSFLKEFGTRATAKGLGGWAGLKVLASNLNVVDTQYTMSADPQYTVSVDPELGNEPSSDHYAETVVVVEPVRKRAKKLKKKIKKRAPKPVVETIAEENTPGEIQQESFQEILSESETESGGTLVGDDLDLSDVLGVEEEPEQELF